MNIGLKILYFGMVIIVSYLVGAIPNGLILGKVFKHIDIREYGSHNSGGTNVGRVLGHKLGVLTIALDALKIVIPFWIIRLVLPVLGIGINLTCTLGYVALFSACLGHCFPIYCKFKGGKAVSSYFGCLLATNYVLALIFMIVFAIILIKKRYVSLGSIGGAIIAMIVSILLLNIKMSIGFWPSLESSIIYPVIISLNTILLIERHRANIDRLIIGEESKIKWLDKNK